MTDIDPRSARLAAENRELRQALAGAAHHRLPDGSPCYCHLAFGRHEPRCTRLRTLVLHGVELGEVDPVNPGSYFHPPSKQKQEEHP